MFVCLFCAYHGLLTSMSDRLPYQPVLSCDTLPDGTVNCREYWDLPGALAVSLSEDLIRKHPQYTLTHGVWQVAARRSDQELAERRAIQKKIDERRQQERADATDTLREEL